MAEKTEYMRRIIHILRRMDVVQLRRVYCFLKGYETK